MRFLTRMAVLFYVTFVLFVGCFTILFVLNHVSLQNVLLALYAIYRDQTLQLAVGGMAGALLLINYVFYQLFSVNTHREKIIAFDNPSGRVSVALAALEDMIRRTLVRLSEIKDVRVNIRASGRGLRVRIRSVLCSEVNIPEATSKVQELTRKKIQDIIGLDEPVNVSVYIGKIISECPKEKRPNKRQQDEEGSEADVPFQGYRA